MSTVWMAYSLVVGVLMCAAALALEHVVGIWRLPRRGIWIVAMLVTVAAPFLPSQRSRTRAQPGLALTRAAPPMTTTRTAGRPAMPHLPWRVRVYSWSLRIDGTTRIVWVTASATIALVFAAACGSMLRRRRSWREGMLHGHCVLFSDQIGPAVVGFIRPRIVIPEWALSLPARERRLMLEHESEHLRANDPSLLLLAGVLLVLFPWNATLWFMTRRLRLAIEIDCDTRVVGGGQATEEYGLFLVAVGERRLQGLFLAAALAERRSSLERRIHAMTILRPRHPLLASVPFAALALGAAALAAQTPTPPNTAAGVIGRASMDGVNRGIVLTEGQVREFIANRYPAIANGTSEQNVINIVLASNGDLVLTGAARLTEVPVTEPGSLARRASATATRAVYPEEVPPTTAVRAVRTEDVARDTVAASGAPTYWHFAGIGRIDRTLIKGSSQMRFVAGVVSPRAITVNVVTLTGNSTGR